MGDLGSQILSKRQSGAEKVLKEAALLGVPLVAMQDVAALMGVDLEKSLDTQIVAQKMAR